jgi:hypothetical protein
VPIFSDVSYVTTVPAYVSRARFPPLAKIVWNDTARSSRGRRRLPSINSLQSDADEDARAKAIEISGLQKIPVIVFPNGEFLSEPSNPQIEEQLKANNLVD